MKSKLARNVFSALLLGGFVMVAAGTSYPEKERLGEFALAFSVADRTAHLLHYTTGPFQPGPPKNRGLHLTTIGQDGSVIELQHVTIRPLDPSQIGAAVTGSADGVVAFAVGESSSRGPFTVLMTDSGEPPVITYQPGGESYTGVGTGVLSIVKRDANRHWAYYSRANRKLGSDFLPLWQIQNGESAIFANSVVWAACTETLCQQVRYEQSSLRLYVYPVAGDFKRHLVAEVRANGMNYYADMTTDGTPILAFGTERYALSLTSPSLQLLGSADDDDPYRSNAVSSDELADGGVYEDGYGYSYRADSVFSGAFADGFRITVSSEPDEAASKSYCDEDCRVNYDVFELWVRIKGPNYQNVPSFVLHDY